MHARNTPQHVGNRPCGSKHSSHTLSHIPPALAVCFAAMTSGLTLTATPNLELFGPTHPWSCQQQVCSPQVSDADDVWVLFVGFFMLHLMVCLNFAAGQCPPLLWAVQCCCCAKIWLETTPVHPTTHSTLSANTGRPLKQLHTINTSGDRAWGA